MATLEITGRIIDIKTTTGQSAKGDWTKQEVLIEHESGQYPKRLVIENFNIKVPGLAIGHEIKAFCNLDATEYNGRWFNKISFWKAEILNQSAQPAPQAQQTTSPAASTQGDLPF
jgi:hypothetical protein